MFVKLIFKLTDFLPVDTLVISFVQPRPFSPPLTSNSSPPPAAPLARAESISSISSSASLSAANTPTVGKLRYPC